MRTGFLASLLGAALIGAVTAGLPSPAAAAAAIKPPDAQTLTQDLKSAAALFHLPGFSAAVVQDGKIIYRLNVGYADVAAKTPVSDNSIFALASVTKSFTGVMMMQYEEEGKIRLDDNLLSYPFDTKAYSPDVLDPTTRVHDVLSMTSGGAPGATYSYNGGRFNFLSGVFEKISGEPSQAAYAAEVKARILTPLRMDSSFDGFAAAPAALTSRIVHRYKVAMGPDGAVFTDVPYDAAAAYPAPAAGLFSTIDDLAAYATALDRDVLMPRARYEEMTTPARLSGGEAAPYGLGWLTQTWNGTALNWVYGEGNQDAALFLRLPAQGLTFIFLTNSGDPSHAARLQSGDVLRSPFAVAFLKTYATAGSAGPTDYDADLPAVRRSIQGRAQRADPIVYDELFTAALARNYLRTAFKTDTRRPEDLTRLLYELHPQAFDAPDIPLMVLMSRLDAPDLREAGARLVRAFDAANETRPEALYFVGKYFEKIGDEASAARYFRRLADEPGFIDEGAKIDACALLGRYEIKQGKIAEGRDDLWRSLRYARAAGYSQSYVASLLAEVKAAPAGN